jgi:hypothetical protein
MYSIADPIKSLIKARDRKILEMERNFEDHRRIAKYKQESLDAIRSTYIDLCRKIRTGILEEQEKVKAKYETKITADEISRDVIRAGAMTTKQLLQKSEFFRTSNLPIRSDIALILARELRTRGGKDNVSEADALAIHVETFLDKPWVRDDAYISLKKLENTTNIMESQAQAGEMLVLSLQPTRNDILTIQGTDIIYKEVPGAAREAEKKEAIQEGVDNFGIQTQTQ